MKTTKEQLNKISLDINIIIEAINNEDFKDAVEMLEDIARDLKVITLMC